MTFIQKKCPLVFQRTVIINPLITTILNRLGANAGGDKIK